MAATSSSSKSSIVFYCKDMLTNRNYLFKDAITNAKRGKVLYIAKEEFTELPELSQDITTVSRQYMKMISFLYARTLQSLLESISSLPDWQNVPCAIILENLTDYCPKERLQNACALISLLIDTARSCSTSSGNYCQLFVSVNKEAGQEYSKFIQEFCSTV